MTGVADGVGLRGAGMSLVEAWAAPRADPARLGAVMGTVGARCAFSTLGVAATDTTIHDTPAWTTSAAMAAAFLMPDARPGLAHLEQGQMQLVRRNLIGIRRFSRR